MSVRYTAGASGLPFGVLRGYVGTDLPAHSTTISSIECPFTGESLTAVSALTPDVGIIHAQQVDRDGNIGIWGIQGVQKEAVLASRRSIVTVEEVVDEFDSRVRLVLPSWVVSAVAVVPQGAHPSYAHGYYTRDNAYYRDWDAISRARDTFAEWNRTHILDTADFAEHLAMSRTHLVGA